MHSFSIWSSVLELCFRCYDPFDNGYDRFSEHDDRLSNGCAFYNAHGPGGGMAGPGQAGLSQLDPAWLGWATGRAGLAPAGFGRAPAAPRLGRPGPSRAPAAHPPAPWPALALELPRPRGPNSSEIAKSRSRNPMRNPMLDLNKIIPSCSKPSYFI